RNDVDRNFCVFEIAIRQIAFDQLAQAIGCNQIVAAQQKAEKCPPADGKDVASAQPAPDRRELLDALTRGITGVIRTIERANTGPDDKISGDIARCERMQHANLDGAKAAAAGKDEGRLRPNTFNSHGRNAPVTPPCAGIPGASARCHGSSLAYGW